MIAVQLAFNAELLDDADADEQVQSVGRSEVFRELAKSHLRQRWEAALDGRYVVGYGGDSSVSEELEGWAGESI